MTNVAEPDEGVVIAEGWKVGLPFTIKLVCIDPDGGHIFVSAHGWAKILSNQHMVLQNINARSPLNARPLQSPVAFARIGWVTRAAANNSHS